MILSFDVSTSYIGWCLLNDDGSFADIGYVELKDIKNEYRKVDAFRNTLETAIDCSGDVFIFVEAPLRGSNNQNVVNKLQRFNGMICQVLYGYYGVEPILLTELEVRKINGILVPKGVKGVEKKKYTLQILQKLDIIPVETWKYKRTGNPQDYCFDMCDAFWVAKAGYLNSLEKHLEQMLEEKSNEIR